MTDLKMDLAEQIQKRHQARIADEQAAMIRAKRIKEIERQKRERKADERVDFFFFSVMVLFLTTLLWMIG